MEQKTLTEWLTDRYMSSATLADKAGVDRALISRLRHGKQPGSRLETIKKIADALGVDPMQVTELAAIVERKEIALAQ